VFDFDEETKRMRVEALHPGASLEEVKERTDFELMVPDNIPNTEPPTEEELRILRVLDPEQRYTKAQEE